MSSSARAQTPDCKKYDTNTPLTNDLLKPGLLPPCEPSVTGKPDTDFVTPLKMLRHGFDLYSWLTFAALNSPADRTRAIGQGAGPKGDAPTIWESYKQLQDVMLPDGSKPAPWQEDNAVFPPACERLSGPGKFVIHMQEETFNQPFKSGPLIDQNGHYALFVILMNRPMFEYIVDNQLYSRKGQEAFAKTVEFPTGSNTAPAGGTIGAVMIKGAWKILGSGDDRARFHAVDALIYTPASPDGKAPATCVEKTVGLVGLHVAHKTSHAPQWVWTTFEHVDNVPTDADVAANKLKAHYNFYDPGCDVVKCPINQLPPWPWEPRLRNPERPFTDFKSQIVRTVLAPTQDDVDKINAAAQSLAGLKDTVWANYMLVTTQWPTDFQNKTDPTGVPAPPVLANSTLETFSQGKVPIASSSCMGCHNNATTHHNPATRSDFTFIPEKAQ
ncbi:MAG: cytochrome C [Alphaproteobacteria bacterium]